MKIYLYFIICLLFISSVFATDAGLVNQETTVWCSIQEFGLPISALYAEISIYTPNSTLIVYDNATFFDIGIYTYSFTPNVTGNHILLCNFYNSTSLIGQATESVIIKKDVGEVIDMEILSLYLMFVIGGIFIFLGAYTGYSLYFYGGAVWYIINSFYALNTLTGLSNVGFVFFMLIGIGTLLYAVDDTRRNYKKVKRFEIDD
jgi:hypothetical protein